MGEEPTQRAALVEEPEHEPVSQTPPTPDSRSIIEETAADREDEVVRMEPAAAGSGDQWARVLRSPGLPTVLRTILTNLRPVVFDAAAGRIVLSGASRYAESARARLSLIVDACRKELGRSVEIVIQSDDVQSDAAPVELVQTSARLPAGPTSREEPGADEAVAVVPTPAPTPMTVPSQHPLVKEAMELFGARIVDVQHRRPSV